MVKKALIGAACLVALMPVLFVGAGMAMFMLGGDEWPPVAWGADNDTALFGMPDEMRALYEEAGERFGVQPGLLAAVGKVECDHGLNPRCATPNEAGAVGPMQFIPDTFARWGSASGSPAPDPRNPRDAVFAAAAKLAADGAADDPSGALYSYNHSGAYVAVVEGWALRYGWRPPSLAIFSEAVLDHPNIGLRPEAADDVRAGRVDGRVLAALVVMATGHELSYVGPFVTGHSFYVAGTDSPSNHAFGRAVDVPVVDRAPVSPSNEDARLALLNVADLPDGLRPTEIGCPWADAAKGAFTKGHSDHVHLGFDS
jgi:hypothetical protein